MMLNEKELQERVNRRLSGLCADELRRRRILATVHHEACVPPVRRLSPALVCLLIVLLVTGSIALADHLNLFSLFGRGDGRYAQVAQQAGQVTASPVEIPDEAQNRAVAQIDSAFYDGLTLNLAFSIAQGTHYEPYVPDASELAAMEETEAMPVVIEHPQAPGAEVLAAYNQALENATPCGYRTKIIYASDHTLTDDGIDLPPYAASVTYTEDGACHEMREFESPLPGTLAEREQLELHITLYQSVQTVYFDGEKCFSTIGRTEVGTLVATVPRTADAVLSMAGTAQFSGVSCMTRAQVSPMSAVVTLSCEEPLETLLAPPPASVDPMDAWVEVKAVDEQGRVYKPETAYPLGESKVQFTLLGVGELPETLTLYAGYLWEGAEDETLDIQSIIVLDPVQ